MAIMNRMAAIGTIGILTLATLAGCSSSTPKASTDSSAAQSPASTSMSSSTSSTPSQSPMAQTTAPQSTTSSSTKAETETSNPAFKGLFEVISKTKKATEAGDFAQAKTEFNQFEDYWKQVEDGVKTKASTTYDAIESSMDEISGELNAAQPDKAKILSSLKSLKADVNSASK